MENLQIICVPWHIVPHEKAGDTMTQMTREVSWEAGGGPGERSRVQSVIIICNYPKDSLEREFKRDGKNYEAN